MHTMSQNIENSVGAQLAQMLYGVTPKASRMPGLLQRMRLAFELRQS